ncbi:MAG: Acetyl-coenzyme A carboxylase carboxyl transferase subunit alpha [Alphaproteobacteria bacterium MarineAlpha5_Bin11]|nr:acetyl-CoA carboxylase carboxyl transferase subunit alpha [Pelagibacteraceae bacterium]PPR44520.1 MAG: Acetyl-coenzyme A carboxylase carboxyl transferase subunit alpha [Alphaproteobacteria bacterium MarineAlpha5_Bin11]PPR50328.1 MAG: Acetyl-coenzyme A carboxylase carboxyl transferase subunit alpha [Alphaproteobacteria bacterium MarineAlpha5_Bin10]
MTSYYLDFEKSLSDIEKRIRNEDLKEDEKRNLESEGDLKLKEIYSNLSSWQKVQIARHPERPHATDYIKKLFSNFVQLKGDKKFADDPAIISGLANFRDNSVIVIGTEKGNSMETRIKHNFGMARPEGYRKVQRLFNLASKFNLPLIIFVDTAGAYPGKDAEERGQAEAIASSISASLKTAVPIVSIIIGEGGSGGAIALATADRVLMLENSIYSVISPEGCASILWNDINYVQNAAEALNLTAENCKKFAVIDEIIPEKYGGAHRNIDETISQVGSFIEKNLSSLLQKNKKDLIEERNKKFINMTL